MIGTVWNTRLFGGSGPMKKVVVIATDDPKIPARPIRVCLCTPEGKPNSAYWRVAPKDLIPA